MLRSMTCLRSHIGLRTKRSQIRITRDGKGLYTEGKGKLRDLNHLQLILTVICKIYHRGVSLVIKLYTVMRF